MSLAFKVSLPNWSCSFSLDSWLWRVELRFDLRPSLRIYGSGTFINCRSTGVVKFKAPCWALVRLELLSWLLLEIDPNDPRLYSLFLLSLSCWLRLIIWSSLLFCSTRELWDWLDFIIFFWGRPLFLITFPAWKFTDCETIGCCSSGSCCKVDIGFAAVCMK